MALSNCKGVSQPGLRCWRGWLSIHMVFWVWVNPKEVSDLILAKSRGIMVGDHSVRFSRSPSETIYHMGWGWGRGFHLWLECFWHRRNIGTHTYTHRWADPNDLCGMAICLTLLVPFYGKRVRWSNGWILQCFQTCSPFLAGVLLLLVFLF